MKTTKKDFELFESECKKWIERFGLKCWEICYMHTKLGNDRTAECSYDMMGRTATLSLNTEIDDDMYGGRSIHRDAFHEVAELLLVRIRVLSMQKRATEDDIHEEIHSIIRVLENSLFDHCEEKIEGSEIAEGTE